MNYSVQAIQELESLGYVFTLTENGRIRFRYAGAGEPPKEAFELLQEVKASRDEAVNYLRQKDAELQRFVAEATRLLKNQGWAVMRSKVLDNEEVLLVRDTTVVVPTRWKKAVAYTLLELQNLVASNPTQEELRLIHRAKKIFNPAPGSVQDMDSSFPVSQPEIGISSLERNW